MNPTLYPEYAAECGDPSRTKRLGFGARPAILLVDVCEAYCSASSALALPDKSVERACNSIGALLKAARTQKRDEDGAIPIIFAQTLYTHPNLLDAGLIAMKNKHANLFYANHEANLTSLPHVYPDLHPTTADLQLKKKYPSPFLGTNLATQLAALGVDTLIIGGFTTSVGVRAAVLDAMQSGFRAMVVANMCADRDEKTHWANLMDMGAKYSDVVGLQEACEQVAIGWRWNKT
jgi:maleamate amidohydrolase